MEAETKLTCACGKAYRVAAKRITGGGPITCPSCGRAISAPPPTSIEFATVPEIGPTTEMSTAGKRTTFAATDCAQPGINKIVAQMVTSITRNKRNQLIVILVLAAALFSAWGLVKKSPSQVVAAFYKTANDGKYSEIEQYLSVDAHNLFRGTLGTLAGGMKGICDKTTKNGTITNIEILSEVVRGEGATVIARIHFKDGTVNANDKTELIKEKGEWKIAVGH